jgi:hypothetical protein
MFLNNINELIFVRKKYCVSCEVQTQFLNVNLNQFRLKMVATII